MPVIKYDVSNVPEGGGGVQPQPGLYKGKIVSMTKRAKKSAGDPVSDLEVVVDVGADFARVWTYVKLPDDPNYNEAAHGWKLRELTDALGLPPKGSFDPKKQEGKPVTVKISADTDQSGDYRGKVKNLFKPGSGPEPTVGGDDEATDELTEEALQEWSVEDLKGELEERGIRIAGRFSSDKAIAAILEDAGGAEPEDETEPETEDGEFDISTVEGYEDFAEWGVDDLKADLEERNIKLTGRFSEAKARDAIIEAVEAEAGGEESAEAEAEETAPVDDYDEWPESDLLDEINTRNEQGAEIKITGRKTKEKMIEALREDDITAEPF